MSYFIWKSQRGPLEFFVSLLMNKLFQSVKFQENGKNVKPFCIFVPMAYLDWAYIMATDTDYIQKCVSFGMFWVVNGDWGFVRLTIINWQILDFTYLLNLKTKIQFWVKIEKRICGLRLFTHFNFTKAYGTWIIWGVTISMVLSITSSKSYTYVNLTPLDKCVVFAKLIKKKNKK